MKNHHYFLNENEMLDLAAKLASSVAAMKSEGGESRIIFLSGPLGAGKTTFTRGFLRGLGYKGKVKSPTYTLVEPYEINGREIFHFDLYRLQSAGELDQLGMRDYFSSNAICIIEWPDKGFPLLPSPDLICHIAFSGIGRELTLEIRSVRGEAILELLC